MRKLATRLTQNAAPLTFATLTAASVFVAGTADAALIRYAGFTDNDWQKASNWADAALAPLGSTPWDLPSSPADDLRLDAVMEVNSTEVYTTGPNTGQPFKFRRIKPAGGATLRIVTGGTLDFGGAADSRIELTDTGSNLVMTGGTLQTTQSNLNGVNISGHNAFMEVGGASIVSITDPTASASIIFVGSGFDRTLHVKGSNATIGIDQLRFNSGTQAVTKFTLDAAGASAIQIADLLDFTPAGSATLNIHGTALVGTPAIELFDLANGSSGAFTSIVTDGGTFSGADGTQVTINGNLYEIDYQFGDGNDIGLTFVPEPASAALLATGAGLMLYRRRR